MIKKILFIIFGIILMTLGLLQFPELFVSKKLKYKSFELYSKEPINQSNELERVLDSVIVNLKRSHFYQPSQIFELYFVKETVYESLAKLFGANNIASSKYNKHIYYGMPEFELSKLVKGSNELEWVNLVQIISHEAVHSQMYKDYSLLGFMKTPTWINEGYCEYISYYPLKNKQEYKLVNLYTIYKKSESNWIETEFGSMTPKFYLRDRIIMEYLIDYKKLNILEIIENETFDPELLMNEIETKFK